MIDPITIGALSLLFLAFKKQQGQKHGELTPEREEMYVNAMQHLLDPERLKKLSEEFEQAGLKTQAFLLKTRAAWRARPDSVKAAHDEIFSKAMLSENINAVLEIAQHFENMTATVLAGKLRRHAADLKKDKAPPVPPEEQPQVVETTAETANGKATAHPAE